MYEALLREILCGKPFFESVPSGTEWNNKNQSVEQQELRRIVPVYKE